MIDTTTLGELESIFDSLVVVGSKIKNIHLEQLEGLNAPPEVVKGILGSTLSFLTIYTGSLGHMFLMQAVRDPEFDETKYAKLQSYVKEVETKFLGRI